ncbi:MAG TPA: hypothetical protein DCG60_02175 [Tissierella sp.]|uniref:DUF4430 domain-containing protein n=1 Tax=Tissierella praeacuta TaxID=43131 RepID=UPI000EBD5F87|nr:DUF4430 domain-containing protein [Tissierella praeacuta]HAE91441.1 hypothetical protein [Tissierella sp.]
MKSKFNRNKIIASLIILGILVFTFWYGGNAPGLRGWNIRQEPAKKAESVDLEDNNVQKENKSLSEDSIEENSEDIEKVEIEDKLEDKLKEVKEEIGKMEKTDKKPLESRPGGVEGGLSASEKIELAKEIAGESSTGVEKGSKSYSESMGMSIDPKTGKDRYLTDPVPDGKPIPIEPQNIEITDVERYCILSVRCDTILDNMDWLDPEKIELVPEDGVIFAAKKVKFYEGESVFNLLLREMKKAKIHMEFSNTPMYNSAYIEGINNLYEFDCGELSGWMYKVNGWFPNYGCSRYALKEGDIVEWVYTCNLGVDVGGFSAIGGE